MAAARKKIMQRAVITKLSNEKPRCVQLTQPWVSPFLFLSSNRVLCASTPLIIAHLTGLAEAQAKHEEITVTFVRKWLCLSLPCLFTSLLYHRGPPSSSYYVCTHIGFSVFREKVSFSFLFQFYFFSSPSLISRRKKIMDNWRLCFFLFARAPGKERKKNSTTYGDRREKHNWRVRMRSRIMGESTYKRMRRDRSIEASFGDIGGR